MTTTTTHHVELSPTSIVIDGHDISAAVESYTLKASADGKATLTVDLLVLQGGWRGGEAEVVIPVNTREALVALGWTPPEE